jgi:hypothetical protein
VGVRRPCVAGRAAVSTRQWKILRKIFRADVEMPVSLATRCRDRRDRYGPRQSPEEGAVTMRFMIMIKASEQVGPPTPALMEAMGKRMGELMGSGVMVDAGGLLPSPAGARVRLSGGRVATIDGPFAEAKELVGGYSIVQVAARQEAIGLATELIQMHKDHWPGWEGEAEIRQLADAPPEPAG